MRRFTRAGSVPEASERIHGPGTWLMRLHGVFFRRLAARRRAEATRAATVRLLSPGTARDSSAALTAPTSTWMSTRSRSGPDSREK